MRLLVHGLRRLLHQVWARCPGLGSLGAAIYPFGCRLPAGSCVWIAALAWLLSASLLLAAPAARGAEPVPLKLNGQPVDFAFWAPVGPRFEPAEAVLADERRAVFDEAGIDGLFGLYRSEIHFGAGGAIEEREVRVRHLLTKAAVHDDGNQTHWVDGFAETASIEEAYTLLPDGRRVMADVSTLQLRADDDDDIFTDSFEIVVPFQGLKPGATTVLVVRTRQRPDGRALPFSRIFYPQIFSHMERFEVELTWDAGVTPPIWRTDFADLDCALKSSRRLLCRAEHVEPYPEDPDIRYSDTLPTLVVGEATTWHNLAGRVRGYVEGAYSEPGALDRDLEAILADAESPDEVLARIHAFVSQEVRYLGLEQGFGGVIPRPTGLTLSRRFGDCKDKATLFVDLARRAGFEAYTVLTSNQRKNLEKLLIPAAGYFNHMIACVRLPARDGGAGGERCLDLTDPLAAYDSLTQSVQAAVRLDVREETTAPGHLPAEAFTWSFEMETETRLQRDGSLDESKRRVYGGANASWLRERLQSRNRQEREDWLRDDFEGDHHEAVELRSIAAEGVDESASRAVIRSEAHLSDSFDPETWRSYGDWESELIDELTWFKTENEVHDFDFDGLRYRSKRVYHLPPSHRPAYPGATIDFDSPFGRYRRNYRLADALVVVETELEMPRARIALEDIPRFNRFIDNVVEHAGIYFDVARADGTP